MISRAYLDHLYGVLYERGARLRAAVENQSKPQPAPCEQCMAMGDDHRKVKDAERLHAEAERSLDAYLAAHGGGADQPNT